jgi:sugar lactone lactonase YvrE
MNVHSHVGISPRVCCLFVLAFLITPSTLLAADAKRWQPIREPGEFVVSLAQDSRGIVWIGTEDKGVWRYDPKAEVPKHLKQFTTKDGLGDDNVYAVTLDKIGRVWVGHLNHGVSVFNGEKWKNFDVADGPIGERIFALATCPVDGDVWMATSAGLTRYSVTKDIWSYYTTATGLPENQANALAFDTQGNLYVGTQCHGIAKAKASEDYKKWTVIAGKGMQLPVTSIGTGLPTSLINALLVSKNGTVYAGTTAGLAWSKDKGVTWEYLRGRDYGAKVESRSGGKPTGWKSPTDKDLESLLAEDYITCLAEDENGLIWVGFREKGCVALNPKNNQRMFESTNKADGLLDDYVYTILPTSDCRPVIGTYGQGVAQAARPFGSVESKDKSEQVVDKKPELPSPAKPLTPAEINEIKEELRKEASTKGGVTLVGMSLDDDWRTQGDFYGSDKLRNYRYGEWHAELCAFCSPFDAVWGRKGVAVGGRVGQNRSKDDSLRHWVHWRETDNVRSLKNPFQGGRRQSEWDDHGEAYPMTHEGPSLFVTVHLPPGAFNLSFYFFNKDGHQGNNRFRDFLITVKSPCRSEVEYLRAPVIAQGRVKDFWGGVYKGFALRGGEKYSVQIHDNWSFNTILSGVFIDPIVVSPEEKPFMADIPRVLYAFDREDADELKNSIAKAPEGVSQDILGVLSALQEDRQKSPLAFVSNRRRRGLLLLRTLGGETVDLPKKLVGRARAEAYDAVRMYGERDAVYQRLDQP